ncbi:ferric reduction oxidase 8, mitochondrial [Ricinus communis]|uniref:ferric reduction oxidase 8, mitochondrial n=1 Tax=Ricinus communis TaxID=3988 RepID=UPI0007726253|nr:ferric reduction oxidase 8, mitochondrial [Ricinus communis]|eukprot:XP_015577794.1 ferric reduction oxidase 8, mitochondrial [Ricinus communis]
MAKAVPLAILKVLMILLFAGWVAIWILKPTNLWTRKWKEAEDSARSTVFGYYGLDFAVYTFPIIALAITGLVYLSFLSKEPVTRRQARIPTSGISNPVIVNSFVGVLSTLEILVVLFFILFLAWTYYVRIANDFKKLMPAKSLNLNLWQLKYLRVATRFGLLAEACLALLLLPILRGLALFQLFGIQFEATVRYHVWLGTSMIFFATLHGASTLFIWGVSHHIQDEVRRWQKTGRIYLAGEMALVAGLAIWITSLPQIRRKRFEIFYYTHHLYVVFLIFFLFHAGDRHFYMVFPGIFLFGLDKLLRIVQSKPDTCILSARLFPNKAVELILPKDPSLKYTPTSVIHMKIPSISKFQWHSFSITSSSNIDERTISLIIRGTGGWTSSLYNMIQAELDSNADQMSCIPTAIQGPYGPASVDFLRYDSLLLIAGGIGITPFLSILKEIASLQRSSRSYRLPEQIQLIHVIKNSQDICLLNSISPLLLNQSSKQLRLKLKVFVTQEQKNNATLRELLNDLSLVQTVNFSTKCSNYAIHGLETPLWMAAITALTSIVFLVFLMCFNHLFDPIEKKSAASVKMAVRPEKKVAKEKTPSSIVDILLLSSFIIAVTCSTFIAIILRWKRLKKDIPSVSQRQGIFLEPSSMELRGSREEQEIHFGGRPNFQDIFSKFTNETVGSDVGVLVCGPETMKESVASFCHLKSQGFNVGAEKKKPYFSFHSLSFSL